MPKLVIHQEKVEDPQVLVDICPFGAMEEKDFLSFILSSSALDWYYQFCLKKIWMFLASIVFICFCLIGTTNLCFYYIYVV